MGRPAGLAQRQAEGPWQPAERPAPRLVAAVARRSGPQSPCRPSPGPSAARPRPPPARRRGQAARKQLSQPPLSPPHTAAPSARRWPQPGAPQPQPCAGPRPPNHHPTAAPKSPPWPAHTPYSPPSGAGRAVALHPSGAPLGASGAYAAPAPGGAPAAPQRTPQAAPKAPPPCSRARRAAPWARRPATRPPTRVRCRIVLRPPVAARTCPLMSAIPTRPTADARPPTASGPRALRLRRRHPLNCQQPGSPRPTARMDARPNRTRWEEPRRAPAPRRPPRRQRRATGALKPSVKGSTAPHTGPGHNGGALAARRSLGALGNWPGAASGSRSSPRVRTALS
jgi:hypothetical protein